MAKNTNRVSKTQKNEKMHSTERRLSGRSDTNLDALTAKCVLLSAAKRLLIPLYDESGEEMFVLSVF